MNCLQLYYSRINRGEQRLQLARCRLGAAMGPDTYREHEDVILTMQTRELEEAYRKICRGDDINETINQHKE